MSMRQGKLSCVYMLILLNADSTIVNTKGERPDVMCQTLFDGKTIDNMEFEAVRMIQVRMKDPNGFEGMPQEFSFQSHVADEAWRLMWEGRMMYTELPKCLQTVRAFRFKSSRHYLALYHKLLIRISPSLRYHNYPITLINSLASHYLHHTVPHRIVLATHPMRISNRCRRSTLVTRSRPS